MRFSFHCPSCQGKIEADASLSGSQSPCPHCAAPVAIPEARVDCGSTLGGFRLERRLGKGGMGEVFLARQLSVDRQVAVKVLPPGFAHNPEAVDRFLHEGRLAARLDHFNIVTVHEAGEDNGSFYFAMAYIEGESLAQRLKRDETIPEAEALGIIRTVADALAYAWETFQLLHRDLKPSNIMADHRGRVFLMDLGLAKSLSEESGMTLSGSVLGTPQYMSPEQAMGSSHLSVQTDIYSLGATLYHLVTGTPPFAGDTTLKVLNAHVREPLPPPRSRNPQLSEGCSHLIEVMMAKKPAERYPDWRAVIADIDLVLAGAAPAASEVGRGRRTRPDAEPRGEAAAAASPAASKAAMARQAQAALARQHPAAAPVAVRQRRLTPLWFGIAAAAVVVLALLGLLALRGRGGSAGAARDRTDTTDTTDATDRTGATGTHGAAQAAVDPAEVAAGRRTAEAASAAAPSEAGAGEQRQASPTSQTSPTPQTGPLATPAEPPPAAPPAPAESATPAPGASGPAASAGHLEGERPREPREGWATATGALPATAAADPAQAKLTALLGQVAADLVAGKPAGALQRWQAGSAVPELKPLAEQVDAIGKTLAEVASIPQHLTESFTADVGKTVEIELAKEKITCEVREVSPAGIKVNQAVKVGQGTGTLGRTVQLAELSNAEKLRRLGNGDTPELTLQRGLLALEAGRPDNARRLFEAAGGPLGGALVAELDRQRAEATDAAAEQALSELLRQISASTRLGDKAEVIAGIRKRCGDNPKRYGEGRRQLAEFEKEWGRKEPVKAWVSVLQEALAYPPRQDWTVPDLGLELVWVAPGSFQMGTADVAPPVHAVQISRGFWIGKYEVIQAEYEALLGKNPSTYGGARNPVETVSWSDAVAFCTRLTEREQRAGRLPEGYEYRLPTEAEWEYAARGGAKSQANAAGSGQDFAYSGSNHVDEVAWYCGNSGDRRLEDWEKDEKKRQRSMSSNRCRAHPVGQKAPNELGLYDMSGNVWEHCLDWYDESFYDRSPAVDPVNVQAATGRVFRGGSWGNDPGFLHSTGRNWRVPDYAGDLLGFRACLGPEVGF